MHVLESSYTFFILLRNAKPSSYSQIAYSSTILLCVSFSGQEKMYDVIMQTIEEDLPAFIGNIFTYATNPGLILPAVLLMV